MMMWGARVLVSIEIWVSEKNVVVVVLKKRWVGKWEEQVGCKE